MGFISSDAPRAQWAKISNGKVVLSSKSELPGYQSRVTKVGTIVFERFYDSFEGQLTAISVKEGQFGSQFIFAFRDGEDVTNVCVDYDSRYSRALLNRLLHPSVDFKKTMKITPFDFTTKEDQRRVGINVYQNDQKIENAYTKEEVPDPIKTLVKKVITWDFTPQVEFFEAKMNALILPKLDSALPFIKENKVAQVSSNAVQIEDDFFSFE